MRNNIIRLGILGTLILLCIWQTTLLWLGNMPSHNFLSHASYEGVTQPKEIWVNKSGLAYKIEGDNQDDRLSLITEVTYEIKRGNVKLEEETKYTYEQLLLTEGVIYEYGMPLSLEEIVGSSIEREMNKESIDKVSTLYVDVSEGGSYKTYVYLINPEFEVTHRLTINNQLMLHMKSVSSYSDEDVTEYAKAYQASLLDSNANWKLRGNVFLPQNNQNNPITYPALMLEAIIEGDRDEALRKNLEVYVNDLFKNPIYKQISYQSDSIIFSDNLNLNIRYSKKGTLEFKRNVTKDVAKLSSIEKINKINNFIEESQAIPDFLKQGVYLVDITNNNDTDETTYHFGYRYNNFQMRLTKAVKEELKLDNFLVLVIKGNQITYGKWLMLEPQSVKPKRTLVLTKEAMTASNDIYDLCQISHEEDRPLSELECAYIVEDVDKGIAFDWAALYKGKWYALSRSID